MSNIGEIRSIVRRRLHETDLSAASVAGSNKRCHTVLDGDEDFAMRGYKLQEIFTRLCVPRHWKIVQTSLRNISGDLKLCLRQRGNIDYQALHHSMLENCSKYTINDNGSLTGFREELTQCKDLRGLHACDMQ